MSWNEISPIVMLRVVLHIIFDGMTQREAAVAEHVSLASVNKIWQDYCVKVALAGLDAVLEADNLLGAQDLANTARLMRRLGLTPAECNRALPFAGLCQQLKVPPDSVRDLVESALRLGQPDFRRDEYAAVLARIYRREVASGLTIEQVDAAHQSALAGLERSRAEDSNLQTTISRHRTTIRNQVAHSARVAAEIEDRQRGLAPLDALLATADVTRQQLNAYVDDKRFLHDFGFEIRDVHMVRSVITGFISMGQNPHLILVAVQQIGNLDTALTNKTNEVEAKQRELESVNGSKAEVEKAIQKKHAEERRIALAIEVLEQKKQDETRRVDEARREADRKIAEINREVDVKLKAAETTKQQVDEYVASRERFRKVGLEI